MGENLDLALAIEAIAAREGDPVSRFIKSLPDGGPDRIRSFAQETVRLRQELLDHVQQGLVETDPHRSAGHAEWLSRHAHEVFFRWSSLMRAVQFWAERDVEALSFRVTPTQRHGVGPEEP